MVKKFMAAMLALTVCAGLAGCGDTSEGGSDSKETTTTTTTAAEESAAEESSAAETAAEDDESEETAEEKDDQESKSEENESDKEEEPAEEEGPAEESGETEGSFSNDVYSVNIDTEKWIALTDYQSFLSEAAADKADLFDPEAFSAMLGGIYFYGDDIEDNYASNVIFSNPTYDATIGDLTIADMMDPLVQSVMQQMSAVDFMQVVSSDMVSHNGVDMLRISIHADTGDIVYDCDEYVFIKDSKLCIITFNYDTEDGSKADFESILDSVAFV